ncbi:uncharacterized protein [Chanodichthys erythropterus]|uniref:uncharacterized protein isoform X2 n=1 Tax=Chanodichthys erythropterus TaxID=933992 RepID=UPI00351E1A36
MMPTRVRLRFLLTVFLVSVLPGAASLTLHGEKGGNITLECGLSTIEDSSVLLKHGSITAYGLQPDNQYMGRVHKSGLCDLVLQDLKTTDAGRYRLYIYEREHLMSDISLEIHINDTLTGREGEELVFGDLPRDAESVHHQTDTGWTEVWKRGKGVLSDCLTDNDGHLIIRDFRSSDAGEYRVLNKTGGILITLTVKESGTESKGNLNSTNDDSVDTEQQRK